MIHQVYLNLGVKGDKLYISCHYFINYFKTNFKKEIYLEELISNHDYFKQFQQVNHIEKNKYQIIESENSNEIKVDLEIVSKTPKNIALILDKKKKAEQEILEEYKSIIMKLYKIKSQIIGMNSNILTNFRLKVRIKA